MKHYVFNEELVDNVAKELHVKDLKNATIGEVCLVAGHLE